MTLYPFGGNFACSRESLRRCKDSSDYGDLTIKERRVSVPWGPTHPIESSNSLRGLLKPRIVSSGFAVYITIHTPGR